MKMIAPTRYRGATDGGGIRYSLARYGGRIESQERCPGVDTVTAAAYVGSA